MLLLLLCIVGNIPQFSLVGIASNSSQPSSPGVFFFVVFINLFILKLYFMLL